MTVPHHSEPAREAVARALCRHRILSNLRFDPEKANDAAFVQRCEDVSWNTGEWLELADAALSASPAPAAGGLEAVREAGDIARFDFYTMKAQIKLALRTLRVVEHYLPAIMDYHAPASGLTGRQVVERVENTIHALASSPETRGENVVSVLTSDIDQWRRDWLDENDPQDGTDCVTPFDAYLYRAALASPAATSAETQGGDGVRENAPLKLALANLTDAFLNRHGCFPLDKTNDKERHWYAAMSEAYRLVGQPDTPARAAALAPSTSAATRGLCCAHCGDTGTITDRVDGEITCPECGYAPAPAVESAQVKEAGWWDKPAPPLPRDGEAAYPIVRDAVLASGDPSPRFVQRRFAIGFNRASGFIERMEAEGLITAWQADIQGRRIRASLDLATDAEG